MNKAKLATAIGAMFAAGIFSGSAAAAGSSTGSLTVQSSVAQSCVVSTTATVAFGAYDPVGANAASPLTNTGGSVSIKCTKGSTGVDIDLDKGANAGAGTQRKMLGQNNGDLLNYNVFQPALTSPWTSCTATAWGTQTGGSTYAPTVATWSATAANTFAVCGSIPAAQNVSADALYQDTVTVTVNF